MAKKKNKLLPILIVSIIANTVLAVTFIAPQVAKFKESRLKQAAESTATVTTTKTDSIFDEINPVNGFEINASYGNLGPQMIAMGVIDGAKFKSVYEKSNQPLTSEQEEILFKGLNQKIKITRDNSYFLLNFFWAVGLANKSKILDEGDMMLYGGKQEAGNFASTGGWSLASGAAMDHYSKHAYITLTAEQQALVDKVSRNIYRPCCGNSTHFPDCNHGMAMLGLLELLAKNGASEQEMYKVALQVNSFWFPQTYIDLATYFKEQGKEWSQVDAKTALSAEYSSAQGYQQTRQQIKSLPKTQQGGGGCGA